MAASPDLTPARPAPRWRQQMASFWRWWTDELAQVVPARLSALRGASRLPTLALEADEVVLVDGRGVVPGPDTRVALVGLDPARQRSAVHALLERAGETRARARLRLEHGAALVRRVTMPAATEENLGRVLGFEMDRLTPFRAEDVYFDYRVLSRDAAAATLVALLAVARRDAVEARIERLRSLGLSVQGVGVADDPAGSGSPLNLLPAEQRGERATTREAYVKWGLAALVAVLFVTALALPVWRKRETVVAVLPQVGRAHGQAQETDKLVRDLDRQVADYNFLLAKKHGTPPVLAYVEEITRLLPDTTWLQQLDIRTAGKTREVQITGETPSASKLIEVLEQSQLVQNATPRGTVTRGSQPSLERFQIVAETRPRTQPEARPVLEGAAPPAAAAPTPAAAPPAAAAPPPAPAKVEPVKPPAKGK